MPTFLTMKPPRRSPSLTRRVSSCGFAASFNRYAVGVAVKQSNANREVIALPFLKAPVRVGLSDHTHNTAKMIKSDTIHFVLPCQLKF